MSITKIVQLKDEVKVEYDGRFKNGEIFDSSNPSNPYFEFEVGSKQVISGFDNALIGMKEGDEKEIKIIPESAYGQPLSKLIKKFPNNGLDTSKLSKGVMVSLQTNDGQQVPAKIIDFDENTIIIDLNHPLAGKTLIFKIKLFEIIS